MARILRQVTVARDGMHNAFTDLCYWQRCHWVSYRKGSAHISLDGQAAISVSADRTRFREAARIKVPGDNRDPKLVVMDETRLAMLLGSWIGGVEARRIHQFIAFSEDGFNWSAPVRILPENQWLWRVRKHGNQYFGLAKDMRRAEGSTAPAKHLELMVSDDLLDWRTLCPIGTDADGTSEADIHWFDDGEAWIISRHAPERRGDAPRDPRRITWFCRAKPPYTQWEIDALPLRIHAPILLPHAGRLYLAGRGFAREQGETSFPFDATLCLWELKRDGVELLLRIPATGDCAYPGLIEDPDGRICLSYYSQHAYITGVLPRPFRQDETITALTANDVYFAELDLSDE